MAEFDADSALADAVLSAPPSIQDTPQDSPPPDASEAPAAAEQYAPKEFDPRWRHPFVGLLYVGALTESFSLFGHEFVIATPTQTERMQIGIVIKDFVDTVAGELAYSTAMVAAFLVSIDGEKLPEPVVNNPKETALHDRFLWVSNNMRRPVVSELYSRCLQLDMEVDGVLEAMGKA